MLTRKKKIGKRQLYRRIANNVQSSLKEVSTLPLNKNGEKNETKSLNINAQSTSKSLKHDENILQTDSVLQAEACDVDTDISVETCDVDTYVSVDAEIFVDACEEINFEFYQQNTKEESSNIYEKESKNDLKYLLIQWCLTFGIAQIAITRLLHILNPFHPELPLDGRSLLKTPVSFIEQKLENGEYCHIGLRSQLAKIISKQTNVNKNLSLSFNIDGVPLFNSNNVQLWPISCLIKNFISSPFIVGLFCGNSKPKPLNTFLEQFINELYSLLQDGINVNNNQFSIKVHSFVCDAPARAFIKCVKSHGGYAACDKCTDYGEYYDNRVIYPNLNATKRTDESFVIKQDEDHHLNTSPLLKLNIGMISVFPIDYMHSICLGVVKKMLCIWTGINHNSGFKVRLGGRAVQLISDHLIFMKPFIPLEFNRKPRILNELPRWKATEFRTFIVYLAPLVLRNKVDVAVYEHTLLLHTAVFILLSKELIASFGLDFVRDLLNNFVEHSKVIYGKQFLVYNVHTLIHLPDDVEKYGPLDLFSGFPFENYFSNVKNLVRSSKKPLQQIFRRLHELSFLNPDSNNIDPQAVQCSVEHVTGPLIYVLNICKQYKKLLYKNTRYSTFDYSAANSYFLSKDRKVVRIENIVLGSDKKTHIIGKQFRVYKSLYLYPVDSQSLNIYFIENMSEFVEYWSLDDIVAKMMILPTTDNKLVSFPILHTHESCNI